MGANPEQASSLDQLSACCAEGTALVDAGPLGIFLGYSIMSTVVYGMVVSSAEMVAAYPYCRGTVGLADRFVDPALGFAMGWNAWFHWGIVIPSQIAAATALIKYWNPSKALIWACPAIFIILTCGSVFGVTVYGEIESTFALIKLSAVSLLITIAMVSGLNDMAHGRSLFRFWNPPINQYLGIPGGKGRFLALCAVLVQAAISFFGTEIPSIIAAELVDAPRVIYTVSKRVWMRITIIYLIAIFFAGTLVPLDVLKNQMDHLNPDDPNSPKNDAPWASSPFITALLRAGSKDYFIADLCMACFVASAASAASAEVFIGARYLYFLAEARHAPRFMGAVWSRKPKPLQSATATNVGNGGGEGQPLASTTVEHDEAHQSTEAGGRQQILKSSASGGHAGAVVPWVGVLATVCFASLSWLCVRPNGDTMTGVERTFLQVESMTTSAALQAWIGTLFTYLRFWRGTSLKDVEDTYPKEIARIKEVRARGQPFWAIYSFTVCVLILLFNGWSLFNPQNADWVIFYSGDPAKFYTYETVRFVTTYAPIPLFILVLFGYKLVCQTRMIRAKEMNFSGVAKVESCKPVEEAPKDFWGRVWWILVK
ncbi:hypothetical protein FRB90_008963 [Tulasnella sp. 427]|nr:hypothetical protein FRB90_008963 [Tulasnella sp. 427]